jgi:hypothetical protein
MKTMKTPGFTAEASLYRTGDHYPSAAFHNGGSVEQGVISQARAGGLGTAFGPFSGSCGCGTGYCCCIFCYFNQCYFWCWSTSRL